MHPRQYLFDASWSGCYFSRRRGRCWVGVGVITEAFHVRLSQLCIFSNWYHCKNRSLALYSQLGHRLCASTCFPVTAHTTNTAPATVGSWIQTMSGPQTATWPWVTTWASGINIDPGRSRTINLDMALSDRKDQYHCLGWRRGSLKPVWPPAAAWPTNNNTDFERPHGSQALLQPGASA